MNPSAERVFLVLRSRDAAPETCRTNRVCKGCGIAACDPGHTLLHHAHVLDCPPSHTFVLNDENRGEGDGSGDEDDDAE